MNPAFLYSSCVYDLLDLEWNPTPPVPVYCDGSCLWDYPCQGPKLSPLHQCLWRSLVLVRHVRSFDRSNCCFRPVRAAQWLSTVSTSKWGVRQSVGRYPDKVVGASGGRQGPYSSWHQTLIDLRRRSIGADVGSIHKLTFLTELQMSDPLKQFDCAEPTIWPPPRKDGYLPWWWIFWHYWGSNGPQMEFWTSWWLFCSAPDRWTKLKYTSLER